MGVVFCKEDSAKRDSGAGQVHQEVPTQKDFQAMGGHCYDKQQYPEAAFWFYQHKMFTLGGAKYDNYDHALENAGKDWEEFTVFLNEHNSNGTINSTTGWNHVKMLWTNMGFERKGGVCFNNNNFPEAAFWFFQHREFRLSGMEYPNVGFSIQNSGAEWVGFEEFLQEKRKAEKITLTTQWSEVLTMWKAR